MTLEQSLAPLAIVIAIFAPIGQVLFERYLQRRDAREAAAPPMRIPSRPKSAIRGLIRALIFALPAAVLVSEVLSHQPITRMSIFAIGLTVSSLVSMIVFEKFRTVILQLLDVQDNTNKIQRGLLDEQRNMSSIQREHVAVTRRVAAGVQANSARASSRAQRGRSSGKRGA
jgi:hypothetical protein